MKKIIQIVFFSFFLFLFHSSSYAQVPVEDENGTSHYKPSINIFTIYSSEDSSALISLSEIYHLNSDSPFGDEAGSLIIPNITERGFEKTQYTLTSGYRLRFLSHTGISETDSVFIYDYQHNRLVTLAVKDLHVIARLIPYASPAEAPFPHYYYMIGFEVNTEVLSEFNGGDVFVYIGTQSPFAQEQLTPLRWNKITSQEFPATSKAQDERFYSSYPWAVNFSSEGGNTYLSETEEFQYFLQDYLSDGEIRVRRLLVVEPQTQEIIIDKIFYESESTSLAPLKGGEGEYNNAFEDESFQWAGKLFEDKPPVVFGFLWVTFGCPAISFIDPSNENIVIYCDNRH